MSKIIEVNEVTAGKLLMICQSCDKTIRDVDGKVNLLSKIRYGIGGPTLESVKKTLEG